MTVLEIMVAAIILSILFGTIFYFFKMGSSAWQLSSRNVDLENQALIALTRMESEIRETVYGSISLATIYDPNDSICFLSMVDASTNVGTFNGSNPEWKKYILYFLSRDQENSTSDYNAYELCTREVFFETYYPGYPEQTIDKFEYHYGFPPPPYTTHLHTEYVNDVIRIPDKFTTSVRTICRYITGIYFSFDPAYVNHILDIELRARKKIEGQDEGSKEIKLKSSIYLRN